MTTINLTNAKLSISYPNTECVSVTIRDSDSGIEIVRAELSFEQFARALATQHERPLDTCKINPSKGIGMVRIIESRVTVCPLSFITDRTKLSQWLIDTAQEPGWIIDPYLGGQKSVTSIRGDSGLQSGCTLNYRVFKYVPKP